MKRLAAIFLLLLFCAAAFAQTADEMYERAVNKYFLGENESAIYYLNEALKEDPSHAKSRQLLGEIQREAGVVTPPQLPSTTHVVEVEKPRIEKTVTPRRERLVKAVMVASPLLVVTKEVVPLVRTASARSFLFSYFVSIILFVAIILIILFAWHMRRRFSYVQCYECKMMNPTEREFCKKCGARMRHPSLTEEQDVWFKKFGWKKNPFTLDIIPNAFAGHRAEIAIINEKLHSLSGHILITGGIGTGKTTLLQWLEKHLSQKFDAIYVSRPPKRPEDLIDMVAATINNKTYITRSYSLYDFQKLCRKHRKNILLLIDEAHEFNAEFEQYLRSIGDISNVFLVMAGLPQTREEMKRCLPALFDRIVEQLVLGALTLDETKELIQKRINNAGGQGLGPFSNSVIEEIFKIAEGIPRRILKLADWLVARATRENELAIDERQIEAYVRSTETLG